MPLLDNSLFPRTFGFYQCLVLRSTITSKSIFPLLYKFSVWQLQAVCTQNQQTEIYAEINTESWVQQDNY